MYGPELFGSRLLLVEDIMKAVNDDKIHMIGICGMGGIGKTTIVRTVVNRARDGCMFDDIAMVVVSQSQNLSWVQDGIAQHLGLQLSEDTAISARAAMLHQNLTQKVSDDKPRRFLIVLDDLWERLDLEQVGIPSTHGLKGCKILLTSRRRDLFVHMGVDTIFNVEALTENDAWDLFVKYGDTQTPFLSDIYPMAREIVRQCAGLPLMIATTAMNLRGRSEDEWRVALRELQRPDFRNDLNERVYRALEVSYSFLGSEEIKKLFRLCSLFPERSKIDIEDLVRYCIGLRLFTDIDDTLQEARNRAHIHIEKLKDSSLLVHSDNIEYVEMEDVLRNMALSIKSSDNIFMVNTGILKEWPRRDSYTEYTSISLNCEEMDELPDGLDCPNLKLLQLTGSSKFSLNFPDMFFAGMREVQVLAFKGASISSLPESLQFLANLRTLSLRDCTLSTNNLSMIGNLEALEIVSFAYCDIKEIPSEVGKLRLLRLLDFTGCVKLRRIAPGVLSSLIALKELYMKGTSVCWAEQMRENRDGEANASFAEVKSLSRLVVMEIPVPYEVLPIAGKKPGLFRKGKRYNMK